MKKGYLLILIVAVSLLSSCSSKKSTVTTKSTVSGKSEKKEILEKEQYLMAQSDIVFSDFKQENGSSLNTFTIDYIGKYKNIAIDKMVKYKIPASITLAQGILESGNGLSTLARKSNNHFGIKCHSDWKGKRVYHDDDKRNECFRKYKNPEGSFDDHSMFLTMRGRYSSLFDLKQDDYKAWAKGLKKAGYATDRKYPSKLISFIENFNLYEYDALVLDQKGFKKAKKNQRYAEKNITSMYIVVNKGDTLYSIARNNNTTVDKIKKRNNLTTNEISIGQKLFLSK
jgi:flagellum-specific peptidoglycan hydrolase FlgJ